MIKLIEQIRQNLREFAYPNEASISHGIVTPVLQALGWNRADPRQLVPEYTVGRGRVDFALLGAGRKPTVFLEVKKNSFREAADQQLFEYAFHEGVPLCVLTNGAEWSFYLPGGQGSYDDRRVYHLQIDGRSTEECEQVLTRYLQRERVCSGHAYEDAQRDYRAAASRREATSALPLAWHHLLEEPDSTIMSLLSDRAESLCGFAPPEEDVIAFLVALSKGPGGHKAYNGNLPRPVAISAASASALAGNSSAPEKPAIISATIFGDVLTFETAKEALLRLLRLITDRDPNRIPQLADRAGKGDKTHIARSIREIHPERPDLALAAEFTPGWFVNINLSNRQKKHILEAARATYGLSSSELRVTLPNS